LVYLIKPFNWNEADSRFLSHQNLKQSRLIAKILSEFGFIVDVADIGARKIAPKYSYDLIISHKYDLDLSTIALKEKAIKLYLSTGLNHIVNNRNLVKRYDEIYQRRNCKLTPRRLTDENMSFIEKADYIVGFGNQFTMNTWSKHFSQPKYCFNNYGIPIQPITEKSFEAARQNFLYFASGGNVGKGLAHLLEVFPKLENLNLYVCGSFRSEPDFCNCYHKELFDTSNIHPIGWVRIDSKKFMDILNQCAYVVLPSCSEGQAGSVVQCMYAGLIPVVTKEVGIDTEDFGITFKNDSLEEIEQTILELSVKPVEWVREKSAATFKVAREKYTEEAFIDRWREIMKDILQIENVIN
jgi:glycosyltransferase involved in cell wall biosynthesis